MNEFNHSNPSPQEIDVAISQTFEPTRKCYHPFQEEYAPLESKRFFHVVDATLKHPAQLVHELVHTKGIKIPGILLLVLLICLAGTGLMMGSFSGNQQLYAVPMKVVTGTLMSSIICIPSLYIMLCMCGSEQNLVQISRILLLGLTLVGILLVGFLPVAWIFSQATNEAGFMGCLYLIIWTIAFAFGMSLLKKSFEFLSDRKMGILRLWFVVFALVLLQMSTTLRPMLGPYETLQLNEKKFFIEHWLNQ
ncbi:MAG: hypothetical protein JXR23_10025 [Pontiellaceae bacterium]|nr:hypothetical protein [Pontiellaceae bacterium]